MHIGASSLQGDGIVIHHLSKSFGSRKVVDDVSFSVRPGRVTGFLGPNGAGKTTTLRMLLGLVTPTSGSVLINGRSYRDLPSPARTVGALLDATGFDPGRTGRNHLRTYAPAAGVSDRRVDEVLDLVELSADANRRVRGYSLGMRQRLALATALLADPHVLICDEPTNGLDPDGIRWLRSLLRDHAARGRAVLVSSHLLAEMQQTIDSVVILNRGKVVYSGDMSEIDGAIRVRSSDNAVLERALRTALPAGASVERSSSDEIVVRGMTAAAVGSTAAQAGVYILGMANDARDLEHLFLNLTQPARQEPAGTVSQEALHA